MADGPVRDFLGTEDGEWKIVNGDFASVAGSAAVPQGIRTRLRLFLGECYLDESKGVPYLDDILIKNPDPLVVRADLSQAIADTPDVTNVAGAELAVSSDREGTISYLVDTAYSTEPFTGQVGVP